MRHAQRHGTPALILKDMLQAWSKTCHDCLGPWPLHPETILCPLLPLLRARARRYIEEHACYARALTRTYKHTRTLWTDQIFKDMVDSGLKADSTTFNAVLSAHCAAGLWQEVPFPPPVFFWTPLLCV